VQWAVPYIDDNTVGARPRAVGDVLSAGDIVLFRVDAEGQLRLAQIPDVQGAFAAIDPQDGAVVALNGGIDFNLNKFNRAVQAKRQPGSAFKPFIYSAALENGFTTASIVNDAPLSLEDAALETTWRPENYNRRFHGDTRLREALVQSMNLVSVRVVRRIGVDPVVRHIRRFGFDDVALPRNLAMSLGAGNISPLELAGGMATFANGGFRVRPYFVQRVEDANGTVLYEAMPELVCLECEQAVEAARAGAKSQPALIEDVTELYPPLRLAPRAISRQNAYLVTDMMQDVVRRGTGAAAYRALRRADIAGKTGTSNDRRDTWFAGFNGDLAAVAWVGFDQDRPLGGNEQGGLTAIPMWIEFMAEALEGLPEHRIERPPGIVEVRIDPSTGLVASDARRDSMFEIFEFDRVPPREPDPVFSGTLDASGPSELPRQGSEPIF
jgi:penicillin-binding protein 1A